LTRSLPLAASLSAFLFAASTSAESPTFSLDWDAPASCPGSVFVVSEISRLLGHAPGKASDRRVDVHAKVSPSGSGFSVHVVLATSDGTGERNFRNASCDGAATATALIASLTIDPDAVTRAAAPPLPPPPPPLAPPPPAPEPEKAKPAFDVGVESLIDVGILPSPAPRLGALVGVSWRRFRAELVAGYDFQQFAAAASHPTEGASLQLDTLKLRACGAPLDRRIELDVCLATEGGWFLTRGQGISSPLSKGYPWWAALGGGRVVWHALNFLELRMQLEAGISLDRPTFQITGSAPTFVHQPSLFFGEGAIAVVVRFQ
jgi:hypothetical protein